MCSTHTDRVIRTACVHLLTIRFISKQSNAAIRKSTCIPDYSIRQSIDVFRTISFFLVIIISQIY